MDSQKGFTLIELLVVITIIGILAAVIFGSLNDARSRGIDAKVLTEMDAISKRAITEQVQLGTYDVVCGSNGITQSTEIADLITSINTLASTTVVCNSDTAEYAVSVGLQDTYWCIDSLGSRVEIPDPLDNTPGSEEFACQ